MTLGAGNPVSVIWEVSMREGALNMTLDPCPRPGQDRCMLGSLAAPRFADTCIFHAAQSGRQCDTL